MARYAIDARASRLTIHAYAGGMLSVMGHDPSVAARTFAGEIRFAPDASDTPGTSEAPDASGLHLTIAAASLSVQNEVSDKDRRQMEQTMHDEVLESAKFPEIVFDASQARVETIGVGGGRFRVEVNGHLSLHGVTRAERVSGQIFEMGDTLRVQGETTLRHSTYGLKQATGAAGTLKVKDELKIVFDLLARKAA
jgi:polyisoprenoid-binding protein YceI